MTTVETLLDDPTRTADYGYFSWEDGAYITESRAHIAKQVQQALERNTEAFGVAASGWEELILDHMLSLSKEELSYVLSHLLELESFVDFCHEKVGEV